MRRRAYGTEPAGVGIWRFFIFGVVLAILVFVIIRNPSVTIDNVPLSTTISNDVNATVTNFPLGENGDLSVEIANGGDVCCNATQQVEVVNFPSNGGVNGTSSSLKTTIDHPILAYGSLSTEQLHPVFQVDAVYGINAVQETVKTTNNASITVDDSMFVLASGTAGDSYGALLSRRRLVHNMGQGFLCYFTALYGPPAVNGTQIAGLGTPEDGIFYGYRDTDFGIFKTDRGKREVRLLTVTNASSTAENVQVELNGVTYNVPVTASGNIQRTVYEISEYIYESWRAEPLDNGVRFIADRAIPAPGAYSFSATTAAAAFSTIRSGALPNNEFIPQALWNADPMDGTGPSGVTLDPSKLNTFAISIGSNSIRFFSEQLVIGNGGTSTYVPMHFINAPNARTTPLFSNPSFPFSAAVATRLTDEDVTLKLLSFSGFTEGQKRYTNNRFTFFEFTTAVTASNYRVLFTIRNALYVNGVTNQGVVVALAIGAAVKHGQPVTIVAFRSSELLQHGLQGNPNFQPYAENTGILYDNQATTFVPSTNAQAIWSIDTSETGNMRDHFLLDQEDTSLQPGESLSLCAISTGGNPTFVSMSLDVREDR